MFRNALFAALAITLYSSPTAMAQVGGEGGRPLVVHGSVEFDFVIPSYLPPHLQADYPDSMANVARIAAWEAFWDDMDTIIAIWGPNFMILEPQESCGWHPTGLFMYRAWGEVTAEIVWYN